MAASSSSMQSIFLASSVAYGAGKNKSVGLSHLVAPTLHSYPHMMRVSSMAQDGQKKQPSTVTNASKFPPPSPSPSPPPPEVSTKFWELFAFSGPAPERINGRLAMVGFVSALAVELYNGQDVFAQLSNGGVSLFGMQLKSKWWPRGSGSKLSESILPPSLHVGLACKDKD
ncbi:unnamed protein product [Prunus armeniaca]